MEQISWNDFEKVELRVGTILKAEDLQGARKPAYKLLIDFGSEIGTKKSSAQITALYKKEELIGKQVVCVVNFPKKNIAGFESEVLTTGFIMPDDLSKVVLIAPDRKVPNGLKLA